MRCLGIATKAPVYKLFTCLLGERAGEEWVGFRVCIVFLFLLLALCCFVAAIDLRKTSSAEITSPNFPGKYPRNSYFKWSVIAPSGFRIKIEFAKFDISDDSSTCQSDALIVRDGLSTESELLERLCSLYSRLPRAVYTSGNSATLEFVSAVENRYEDSIGFKATVSKGKE